MTESCTLCGGKLNPPAQALFDFPTVTSDCRPWKTGRSVAICSDCGVVERVLLSEAADDFADVYQDYEMFAHAADATDQMNFNAGGIPIGRTQKILEGIAAKLPDTPSSVLDIGSGSGAGLIALSQQFDKASIFGFEPNDKPIERQSHLPDNVKAILNQRPDTSKQYDLVTMFHVFEHIEDVYESLDYVRTILSPKGKFLIQVPYVNTGPFDYIIADHTRHFTKNSFIRLFEKAGYTVEYLDNEIIPKELTLLAAPGERKHTMSYDGEAVETMEALDWFVQYKYFLDQVASVEKEIAVFGTGPAGAWAGCVLGDKVVAYLDDDTARINSLFNGKPIIAPSDCGAALAVVAPFPDYQAEWIASRNTHLNIKLFNSHMLQQAS